MDEKYKKYYKQMWETKCARFNAHARICRIESRSSRAVIVLTLVVVALSIFKAGDFFDLPEKIQKGGDIALALSSFVLLVIELYVKGQRYEETAKEFHKSGREIARVYDSYVFAVDSETPDADKIESIIERYHDKIDGREINHLRIDDQLVKAQHPEDFSIHRAISIIYRLYVEIKYFFMSGGLYSLFAYGLLICTILTIAIFAFGVHASD